MTGAASVRRDLERGLTAQINLLQLRGLRLGALRSAALASVPVWLQAQHDVLPALVAWLAVLAQGACLALGLFYLALETRWERRAAVSDPGSPGARVHAPWRAWDDLRGALWLGLALVSLLPWVAVAFETRWPRPLLADLTAAGASVFLLLVLAETAAFLRRADG